MPNDLNPPVELNRDAPLVGAVAPPTMLSGPTLGSYVYSIMGYRVIDVDTHATILDMGFHLNISYSCRLYGIDGPEHNTVAGQLAKQYAQEWFRRQTGLYVRSMAMDDKYGGRYIGVVYGKRTLKGNFTDFNALLARLGFVSTDYFGGTKEPWTPERLKVAEEKCRAELLQDFGIKS